MHSAPDAAKPTATMSKDSEKQEFEEESLAPDFTAPAQIARYVGKSNFFVIRHQQTGFALEAGNRNVRVQHFTGFSYQLWYLESAGGNKVYIINKGNGLFLDVEGGIKEQSNIITFPATRKENQQWFANGDGTLTTPRLNLAVDVFEGRKEAGLRVIAYPRHGKGNQVFHFQYQ